MTDVVPALERLEDENAELRERVRTLTSEVEGEREARSRLDNCLRQKDAAMGELFRRLDAANVDCSDLIS